MAVDPVCYYTCVGVCTAITEGAGLLICIGGCAAACSGIEQARARPFKLRKRDTSVPA